MIRVGLLGSGFMGKTHAQAWRQLENAKVVVVAGLPLDSAAEVAASVHSEVTTSLDEVIARDDVDAIDVCLPTSMHEEFAVKALNTGKHVLCEKPLALSLESADRILEAADKSGRILMVAQVVRFWPQYRAAYEIVRSGELGQLLAARVSRTSRRPNWGAWFNDPEMSGGALFDLHIHDLDYLVALWGKPRSVHGLGVKSRYGSWDYVSTHLDFGCGKAEVEASYLMPDPYPFTTELRLLLERGLLEYNFRVAGNIESRDSSESRLTLWKADGSVLFPAVPETDGYLAEIQHFVDCIVAGKPSERVLNTEVRLVLQIISAIKQSLETGAPVRLQTEDEVMQEETQR
jgi:predicted dehydrogenase